VKKVRQSKQVLVADFKDGKVILDLDTHLPYILNKTASEVWDFCSIPRGIEELVYFFSNKYKIRIDRARKDLGNIIVDFRKRGLVSLSFKKG
jgi:hypothetical protein